MVVERAFLIVKCRDDITDAANHFRKYVCAGPAKSSTVRECFPIGHDNTQTTGHLARSGAEFSDEECIKSHLNRQIDQDPYSDNAIQATVGFSPNPYYGNSMGGLPYPYWY